MLLENIYEVTYNILSNLLNGEVFLHNFYLLYGYGIISIAFFYCLKPNYIKTVEFMIKSIEIGIYSGLNIYSYYIGLTVDNSSLLCYYRDISI